MDFKIRTTKTSSNKTAVQVINYVNRKVNLLKHIGSADTESEILNLKRQAENWIKAEMNKTSLFQNNKDTYFNQYEQQGFTYGFAYEFLENIFKKFNFHKYLDKQIQDLVIGKILNPGSTKNCLEFLEQFLDLKHSETKVYKWFKIFNQNLKDELEKQAVLVAKKEFNFDFSFVLYDVTTLYFESFKNDEFKRPGFSKDNKANQPQIVIGLVVTKEGFPVHYQVFKGNTFEGNTFLPILLDFKKQNQIETLTVVADSAMFSKLNFEKLKENGINYIVGARLANQKQNILDQIETNLKKENNFTLKIEDLIIEYSDLRFRKDKLEMEKQIERAKKFENKDTNKLTKLKFLQNDKVKHFLNQKLIEKQTRLLGLKGYNTNLNLSNQEIISYYHNLFKIEHAFRITKSDLEARPIFHHKENSIQNHILLCFISLTISAYLEIKNNISIKQITKLLKNITDFKVLNKITGEILIDRKKLDSKLENLIKLSY